MLVLAGRIVYRRRCRSTREEWSAANGVLGMESDLARLALEGRDDRFVIGAGFWEDVLSWAIAQGWICDSLKNDHRWDERCEFTAEEASRLAEALDVIGGNLVLQSHENVSEEFLAELADALLTLQKFAESGGFCVVPLK